jgi:hypothetical protein
MRQYCDGEEIHPEILMDLYFFSTPEHENVFGMLSICLYVSMYVTPASHSGRAV